MRERERERERERVCIGLNQQANANNKIQRRWCFKDTKIFTFRVQVYILKMQDIFRAYEKETWQYNWTFVQKLIQM